MTHLLLGSIGVLAETSDLQRESFNQAFNDAGLDWHWSAEDYADMLSQSGGQMRIEQFADARGEQVDAAALHRRKSEIFRGKLSSGADLRPGVEQAVREAKNRGAKIALVSTTASENIEAILAATGLGHETFDLILDAGSVANGKPDPEPYQVALKTLAINADAAIAVEDNPDGVASAVDAGMTCIAFPGAMHTRSSFHRATEVQSHLRIRSDHGVEPQTA